MTCEQGPKALKIRVGIKVEMSQKGPKTVKPRAPTGYHPVATLSFSAS